MMMAVKMVIACLAATSMVVASDDQTLIPDTLPELSTIAMQVNKAGTTWQAEAPERFGSLEAVQRVCGTWVKGHPNHREIDLEVFDDHVMYRNVQVPDSFDARTAFSNCSVISKVRDQSDCGSCWAFGSTEAFEDSKCIATGKDIEYSTMDTAGCCHGLFCGFSMGCGGGQPAAALEWMTRTGVVTGGDYFDKDTGSGCKPYTLAPCAHHVPPTSKYPTCPSKEYSVSCERSCTDEKYTGRYDLDKAKGSHVFSLRSVEAMQKAIMTTGPLAVAFTVYSDFPTYKSGVYKHTTGSALGGHAVEMLGWGTENGEDYWIIKNSWNEQWGDGGFFKIARGSDECGIESDVTGVSF